MDSCVVCGKDISTDDFYASIRRKYCPKCYEDMHRMQKAEWARELRRRTREKNALTRQLCKEQAREIEALRSEIIRLRSGGAV